MVVQAVNALKDQILSAVLGSASCNIADYEEDGDDAYYETSGENVDGGNGSDITHFGKWDSQSEKPTGLSSGDPVRGRSRSIRAVKVKA